MKSLIFAIAAERYAVLPDPTPAHELAALRERLESGPASETDLRELLATVTGARSTSSSQNRCPASGATPSMAWTLSGN